MITRQKPKQTLKEKARDLPVTVQIGKNGLTEAQEAEIDKQLTKRKLIKIKFLKSFIEGRDRFSESQKIADKARATLIDQKGFIIVLFRR